MLTEEQIMAVVVDQLKRFRASLEELVKETTPPVSTPFPTPPTFRISDSLSWPCMVSGHVFFYSFVDENGRMDVMTKDRFHDFARKICEDCGWQPRRILHSIRAIQSATAWCSIRAERRRRAAANIMRQQQRACKALIAELSIMGLSNTKPQQNASQDAAVNLTRDAMLKLVMAYLDELLDAVDDLEKTADSEISMLRPRIFRLNDALTWPCVSFDQVLYRALQDRDGFSIYMYKSSLENDASKVCTICRWQPRRILHTIRVIQAAIGWCRRRAEGLRRAESSFLVGKNNTRGAL